jgi:hypothetical protein
MVLPRSDVAYGSEADVTASNLDVRFTPRKRTFGPSGISDLFLGWWVLAPFDPIGGGSF